MRPPMTSATILEGSFIRAFAESILFQVGIFGWWGFVRVDGWSNMRDFVVVEETVLSVANGKRQVGLPEIWG
jgi:hypothetical protein